MVKGVIFDCDGVMFESRRANLAYYNDILAFFGEEPVTEDDRERANLCHTAASPEVLSTLLGDERLDQALEFAAAIDYRKFIPYMTPEPGLYDVLDSLSARVPLAVATNRGYSMPEILEHFALSRFFTVVVTSRDVERPKPHPDMLLLAREKLGLAAENLLFVGDSIYDRAAAESAGIPFAAYKPTFAADSPVESHHHLMEFVLNGQQV
jgi:HAD superfamily hydrolase (TIGR01509 family)